MNNSIADFKRINFDVEVDNVKIGSFDVYTHNIEEEFWLNKEVCEVAATYYKNYKLESEDSVAIDGTLKIYGDYRTLIDAVNIKLYISSDYTQDEFENGADYRDGMTDYFDEDEEQWLVMNESGDVLVFSTDAYYEFDITDEELEDDELEDFDEDDDTF